MAGKVVMSPISCGRRSIPTILSDRNESGIKLFIDGPRERFFHGIVKYKVDGGKSGNESDFLRPPLDPYNFIVEVAQIFDRTEFGNDEEGAGFEKNGRESKLVACGGGRAKGRNDKGG